MSKSGKQIFEEYAVGTPHDRFVLIYNNYGVFENVIRSYEHSVFKQIRDEKEYNRKHRSAGIEELGIRVQSGGMPSDITAKLAMTNAMIKDAIKTADFESGLLDDTDEPELHRRNILTIHMMKDDFEEFQFHLKNLDPKAYRITIKHITKEWRGEQIAEEECLEFQSFKNILYVSRKSLEEEITPNFRSII